MKAIKSGIARFVRSEDGATAVEYAVMLSLLIVACIATITLLGGNVGALWVTIDNSVG
jgi:pilus assembly protein Flp/PilA